VARVIALRRGAQIRDLLFELAGHRFDLPSITVPIMPRVLTWRASEPHSREIP
jgi:hypothetical protein